MKTTTLLAALTLAAYPLVAQEKPLSNEDRTRHLPPLAVADLPVVPFNAHFAETNGLVVIEAEHFQRQTRDHIRRWYLNSPSKRPSTAPDLDTASVDDASGQAYLEALPDTFVTDDDRPIDGINIGLCPGSIAVLHYRVKFTTPGRYFIWTRMRSNDEEDNTLNAGLDDTWPPSARCLQFQKHTKQWQWNNQIRSPEGPAAPRLLAWLDVETPGTHTVMYSMREDGCEFDKFILTNDPNFKITQGAGPESFKHIMEPPAPPAPPKKRKQPQPTPEAK